MRTLNKSVAAAVVAAAGIGLAQADGHGPDKLFVSVTSDDVQTQGMSMILATQGMQQGQEPRILLCGPGAEMATEDYTADALEPAGANPQQMMSDLIDEGVQVDVCAVFLPNTDYTEDDLIEGVGVAEAPEVAEYMADPSVRYFSN